MIYPPPPGCFVVLPAPTNVSASAVTPTSVTLTWSAVTGAVRYRVVQTSGGLANQTTVTSTTATISGLTPATSYSFQVYAIDAQGQQSQPSNTVTVTTPTPAVNPLGAPSQFGPQPQFGPQNFPAGPSPRWMFYPPMY
jgi:mannan endo-1,4-beta-mannosidase